MKEIWKLIEDGPYEVSNLGNVRNSRSGKHMKTPARRDGYMRVNLTGLGVQYVHRLVCLAFRAVPKSDERYVEHIDGDKSNNSVSNLRWRVNRIKSCKVCGGDHRPRKTQIEAGKGKYCSRQCAGVAMRGEGNPMHGKSITEEQKAKWRATRDKNNSWKFGPHNPRWKGGTQHDGYWYISIRGRQIAEHRLVMERVLARNLRPDEIVHHKNRDKLDNHPANLEIMSRAEHMIEHEVHKARHKKRDQS